MFLLEVADVLDRNKVPYAIVGGYAVALHGAVRATIDLDIAIGLSEADYERAEAALISLGLKPRLPVSAREVFQFRNEYIRNRNLIAWSFFDPIRLARQLDIIIPYDVGKIRTVRIKIHGKSVKVISKDDLIRLKRESGREQDLEDVKALESLS